MLKPEIKITAPLPTPLEKEKGEIETLPSPKEAQQYYDANLLGIKNCKLKPRVNQSLIAPMSLKLKQFKNQKTLRLPIPSNIEGSPLFNI